MPAWLLAHLDREGRIDATAGASRRARAARCPRCRATIIRALDDDWCALTADADPHPLTAEGEAVARLLGIPTYELRQYGSRWQLDRRHRWSIAGRPAGRTPGLDVLAAHRCKPPPLARGPSNIAPPVSSEPTSEQPPF